MFFIMSGWGGRRGSAIELGEGDIETRNSTERSWGGLVDDVRTYYITSRHSETILLYKYLIN